MILASVTIIVGLLSAGIQQRLSKNAIEIYDQSFQSMNYLRMAQNIVIGISRDMSLGKKNDNVYEDQLGSVADALIVARKRAMTEVGRLHAERVLSRVVSFQQAFRRGGEKPTQENFETLESEFDTTISIFAADGFRIRRDAERLVRETQIQIYLAMLGAFLTALLITSLLRRAVVPPIQRAVAFATSIAGGKLDNEIERNGTSETGVLLRALCIMQESIAEKLNSIETLRARQATGYRAEIDLQHARFETALNNMTMGLCMFDADGKLLVRNRRFVEMFGEEPNDDRLSCGFDAHDGNIQSLEGNKQAQHVTLEDGRVISISAEEMTHGGSVVIYEDVTERQKAETNLKYLVRHDTLTRLPNRFFFRERLQEIISQTRVGSLAVMFLDLDRFKIINDTLGHPVGDMLLRAVATRLGDTVDAGETVFRLGGDEFAILCSTIERRGSPDDLAARIIQAFERAFSLDEHDVSIGVSIGIASAAFDGASTDAILKQADIALYEAKAEGRGTYRHFESSMDIRIQTRRKMEIDLRVAIAEGQFELHYQPIIDVKQNTVAACEALVRWRHPNNGLVPPSDFISIAEETGLIVPIGRWVLEEACRQAKTWPDHIKVAVNLSPLQFHSPDFVDEVRGALDRALLPASRLDLEITESLMLQNTPLTLSLLHRLHALGISISMDDFGTGYSSLSYLRLFPFDKIKIDRSFVQDLVDSSDGMSIVKSVIQLGQSLRMRVVAEGVETDEQIRLLESAGCHELQGYRLSRPLPSKSLDTFMKEFETTDSALSASRRKLAAA